MSFASATSVQADGHRFDQCAVLHAQRLRKPGRYALGNHCILSEAGGGALELRAEVRLPGKTGRAMPASDKRQRGYSIANLQLLNALTYGDHLTGKFVT
ncbi:hypothetical protein OKW50_007275 [Paraburkholderia youngii]